MVEGQVGAGRPLGQKSARCDHTGTLGDGLARNGVAAEAIMGLLGRLKLLLSRLDPAAVLQTT
jgi:hypothetical protein